MFDKSNYNSFRRLNHWIDKVDYLSKSNHIKVIIGNKCDIKDQEITNDEIDNFIKKNRYLYTEVSVKNGLNVDKIFLSIINVFTEKLIKGEIIPNVDKSFTTLNFKSLEIQEQGENKKQKCCIIS